jgi:hypothetical protein
MTDEGSQLAISPQLAAAAYNQAWENVRHIRNERIWFTNAYSAIMAGSVALLLKSESATSRSTAAGLLILVLFSFASLISSIRLVVELRNSIANVQRAVDETGLGRMVGTIEPLSGFGARIADAMAVSDLLRPLDGRASGDVRRLPPSVELAAQ